MPRSDHVPCLLHRNGPIPAGVCLGAGTVPEIVAPLSVPRNTNRMDRTSQTAERRIARFIQKTGNNQWYISEQVDLFLI